MSSVNSRLITRLKKARWNLFFRLPWRLWGPVWKLADGQSAAPQRFRRRNAGRNSYVDPSVQIIGYENVFLGDNSSLAEDVFLNCNTRGAVQDSIIIGRYCHIGRRNYFSTGRLIHIKDYVLTGLDCHFLGCGHVIDSPLNPYVATGLTAGAAIEIGINCWITTSVTVLENVRVGMGSVVGARSIVTQDVPPFSIVIGNPAKIVKRFDFKDNRWRRMDEWTDQLEAFMPSESDYLSALHSSREFLGPSIHASSHRFGWLR